MNPFKQITMRGYIGIAILLSLASWGLWYGAKKANLFKSAHAKIVDSKFNVNEDADLVIAYNTFVGVEGLLLMNGGMEPNEQSRMFKDFGLKIQIKRIDKSSDVKDGLKAGALDLAYCTTDALPIDMSSGSSLVADEVVEIMKVNESRGADAIVGVSSIKSVADFKGKTIAYAVGTASNTLLINVLETAGLKMSDVKEYKVADGVEAASAFKAGQCDLAVVWAPDDEDCIASVKGSKIVISTSTATQIIADGLLVKQSILKEKREKIVKLCKAWLIGNAEMNINKESKKEANKLFAEGFDFPEEIAILSSDKVRYSTLGDNKQFFEFDATFTGVTGNKMYSRMSVKYTEAGLASAPAPWRNVSDGSVIEELLKDEFSNDVKQSSYNVPKFTAPTAVEQEAPASSNKVVSLNFETNSASLDEEDKTIIDREVTGAAQGFANARIRVEGNTDNVGNNTTNKPLSLRRAEAVVNYLVSEHKFDRNKFIVKGNGSTKPVCNDNDEGCRSQNRRTDFQFIW